LCGRREADVESRRLRKWGGIGRYYEKGERLYVEVEDCVGGEILCGRREADVEMWKTV
jgi:hypothetical protein